MLSKRIEAVVQTPSSLQRQIMAQNPLIRQETAPSPYVRGERKKERHYLGWIHQLGKIIGFWMLVIFSGISMAANKPIIWYEQDAHDKQSIQLRVDLMLSSDCPHCRAADHFFRRFEKKNHWVSVHRYYINQDKSALDHFNHLLRAESIQMNMFGVPAVFFCNARWLGFDKAHHSAKGIVNALNYCHDQIIASGSLTQSTVKTLRQMNDSHWFESTLDSKTPLITLLMIAATRDATMNYSAAAALLIFVWLTMIRDRRARLATGGLLIGVLGLIHTFQQVNSILFYQVLSYFYLLPIWTALLLVAFLMIYRKRFWGEQSSTQDIPVAIVILLSCLSILAMYPFNQDLLLNFSLIMNNYLLNLKLSSTQFQQYILLYQFNYLLIISLLVGFFYFLWFKLIKAQRLWSRFTAIGLLILVIYFLW